MVDRTGSGTAISGGAFSGTADSGAFDDSLTYPGTTSWASAQTNNSSPNQVTAPSYIGYDFGAGEELTITQINIWQHPDLDGNSLIGTNKIGIEYSDDGAAWTELEKMSPNTRNEYIHTIVASSPSKRYWRLRALANVAGLSGSIWAVREVEMHGTLLSDAGGAGGGFLGIGRRGRALRRRR
jgi:hypothetical protein